MDEVVGVTPQDILSFWRDAGEERWYRKDAAFDEAIRARYLQVWEQASAGELSSWETSDEGALALVIVLDQFPRNMFRGKADSFASDEQARAVATRALANGFDLKSDLPLRHFFYMPFEHSESLSDQNRSVSLFTERVGKDHYTYPYALAHRAEIVRFGRFPSRNNALDRVSTPEEQDFLRRKA